MKPTLITLALAAAIALGATGAASAGAAAPSVAESVVATVKADRPPPSIRYVARARFSRRYCIHLRYLAFQRNNRTARRLYDRNCR